LLALRYLQNFIVTLRQKNGYFVVVKDRACPGQMQPNMANLKRNITVIYVVKAMKPERPMPK
jgi:hypothetical protein